MSFKVSLYLFSTHYRHRIKFLSQVLFLTSLLYIRGMKALVRASFASLKLKVVMVKLLPSPKWHPAPSWFSGGYIIFMEKRKYNDDIYKHTLCI